MHQISVTRFGCENGGTPSNVDAFSDVGCRTPAIPARSSPGKPGLAAASRHPFASPGGWLNLPVARMGARGLCSGIYGVRAFPGGHKVCERSLAAHREGARKQQRWRLGRDCLCLPTACNRTVSGCYSVVVAGFDPPTIDSQNQIVRMQVPTIART